MLRCERAFRFRELHGFSVEVIIVYVCLNVKE